ncbi:hypothetical protein EB796_013192 [Bugula neritina]|uniref:Uncharacterized protein n=1 Tax=Bugula neritina TaxID=10212 RepID=A0A7J7JSQ8_BUGNE|nr:hypothetical protein EB796_013192 [Bugula neritina]
MHSTQQVHVQQPVTIVTQPAPQNDLEDKFQPSALSQMKVLSIMQIVMGVLCIIFGITLAALDYSSYLSSTSEIGVIGYGIWIGLYFILVGGIGMGAVSQNSNGWIVSTMVLNILCSAVWCWMLLSFSSAGLVSMSLNECIWFFCSSNHIADVFYAMDGMMLIMSIIQFVITIWCAALCCGAVCRCCKHTAPSTHMIHYNNGMGTQVMYPSVPMYSTGYHTGMNQAFSVTVQQPQPMGVNYGMQPQPMGGYAIQQQAPPSYVTHSQGPPSYASQAIPPTNKF